LKSGNLVAEGTMYKGIYLKWDEPPDMCKPNLKWKIFVYKDDEAIEGFFFFFVISVCHKEPIPIYNNPGYLFGRDSRVILNYILYLFNIFFVKIADIRLMHPSASSQHAVLYFRKLTVMVKEKNKNNNNNYIEPEKMLKKVIKYFFFFCFSFKIY
jgi:smad nuclear-interacting protein 1